MTSAHLLTQSQITPVATVNFIVLAYIRQRANLAPRYASNANLAAVADEVDVEAVIEFRRDERTKNLVGFFICGGFGNPAEALGDASDVRVHWERWDVITQV